MSTETGTVGPQSAANASHIVTAPEGALIRTCRPAAAYNATHSNGAEHPARNDQTHVRWPVRMGGKFLSQTIRVMAEMAPSSPRVPEKKSGHHPVPPTAPAAGSQRIHDPVQPLRICSRNLGFGRKAPSSPIHGDALHTLNHANRSHAVDYLNGHSPLDRRMLTSTEDASMVCCSRRRVSTSSTDSEQPRASLPESRPKSSTRPSFKTRPRSRVSMAMTV